MDEAKSILLDAADFIGWDEDDMLDVVCDFINERGLVVELKHYIKEEIEDELSDEFENEIEDMEDEDEEGDEE